MSHAEGPFDECTSRHVLTVLCHCSEIDAQTDLHAHRTVVGKVMERHLVVKRRLERDVAVEEEGIAHFARDHDVVALGSEVVILRTCAEKHAALVEIEADSCIHAHIVYLTGMVITHTSVKHEAVSHEIAGIDIKAHAELLAGTVGEAQTRNGGSDVLGALGKLCMRPDGGKHEKEEEC